MFGKIFGAVWGGVKAAGKFLGKAFQIANERGLTDDVVEKAVVLVFEAARLFSSNEQRREWVVAALIATGLKENIARLAVELAVVLVKARG